MAAIWSTTRAILRPRLGGLNELKPRQGHERNHSKMTPLHAPPAVQPTLRAFEECMQQLREAQLTDVRYIAAASKRLSSMTW